MRAFSCLIFCLLCCLTLSAQGAYSVKESLFLPLGAEGAGAKVYLKLPLETGKQVVTEIDFSAVPDARPLAGGTREYRWDVTATSPDSLAFTYRVRTVPVPVWNSDSLRQGRHSITWPAGPAPADPYVLPPLVRADVERTEFSSLDPADTTAADVDRIIRRLDRRVKTVNSLEDFDYSQPLLKDVFDRRTTPRRKHLLLSLALQYLTIPHRVVSGKVLSYGEVRENELWVEVPVNGNYRRVYYGDGIDRSAWGAPDDPDQFLACSYDWRDFTLEVIPAAGEPPVATTFAGTVSNVVVDLWIAKDKALERSRYAEAVRLLDSALLYLPESEVIIAEIGLVYTRAGRPEDGIRFLQQAMKLAESPAERSVTLLQFARYYSLQKDAEKAYRAIVGAEKLAPIDVYSLIYNDPSFAYLVRQGRVRDMIYRYRRTTGSGQ
ncbi:tetratricopeptide repeat protein [Lewinella sp. IMCC34183]|uniref:tetratricopeptide repeat protein n=1 Tax=Lewinella sp. IMCC34183 TaxID=2248762 RepID=UPI000E278039|nr:tetratricopeptide repeat protein [Lewinella sp. IMCC34183]